MKKALAYLDGRTRNLVFWLLCFLSPARARKNLIAYMYATARRYRDKWFEGTEFELFEALTTGRFGKYALEPHERRRLKLFYWASRRHWWHFPDYADKPILVTPAEWSVLKPPVLESVDYDNGYLPN
jgi:hypothetical protein